MLLKVISGGQTGVDRAALDAAEELGLPRGGWCPRGRRAEDGTIPRRYPLTETPSIAYPERTERNIRDSDGTLVLHSGPIDDGTALTVKLARRLGKPLLSIDLQGDPAPVAAGEWIRENALLVVNVAGPRESKCPGIHDRALAYLNEVLQGLL